MVEITLTGVSSFARSLEGASSRKLDKFKSKEMPGCREPRRKSGWTLLGGGNSLASPIAILPVFLAAKTIQRTAEKVSSRKRDSPGPIGITLYVADRGYRRIAACADSRQQGRLFNEP